MILIQHPAISAAERTGYGHISRCVRMCRRCGEAPADWLSGYGTEELCTECVLEEIEELPETELIERLGYIRTEE